MVANVAFAARFDLSPSTTQFIEGCESAVNIEINTEGKSSDAANILIHYNPAEIEIVDQNPSLPGNQIRTGNAYEAYVDNTVLPAEGLIRLTGFSFVQRLTGQATFGTIIFRGKTGVTSTNLTIEFVPGSTTDSNIAEYLTSNDLLTGVTNGTYTFRTGTCVLDTTPPWVTNPSPPPDATGVPLDANISFNIKDNQSGVDLAQLSVKINGIEYTLAGPNIFTYSGNPLDYAITVDPIENFQSGVPVLVEINAADLQGNKMAPYRYVFNQPPVPPPPPPSCESLGCAQPQTCAQMPEIPERIVEEPTVPISQKLTLADVSFYVADGTLQIFPDEKGELTTLIGTKLIVSISFTKFPRDVDNIIFKLGNFSYLLGLSPTGGAYQTTVTLPSLASRFPFIISIAYKDGALDRIDGTLNLLPYGFVWSGTTANRLAGAKVTLYEEYASFRVWDGSRYHQENPTYTNERGEFAFLVPPGKYYVLVQKDGYRDARSEVFEVRNNVVNPRVEMIAKPPSLVEVWEPEAPLTKNIVNVAKNLGQKTVYAGAVTQKEVLDNPKVEKANEQVATPSVAAVALISYSTAISFANLIPYLQFIFTQPILLLSPKRRKGWGVVYNSLSKIPIDLAIVRVYEKISGSLIQTRVTDREGRYAFLLQPGTYLIRVTKPGFSFPTFYLKDKKEDIKYLDLYHGEEIVVTEKNALVTPNIPIDPVEIEKAVPDRRIVLAYFGRKVQDVVAVAGIILATISVLISPKLWMMAVLVAHLLLYGLFRRLSRPRRPKSWGIVYEEKTRAPVGRAIARIFETEYNKLLETQVTDSRGRYSFLVGPSIYYVTFSKPEFKPKRTPPIDLRKVERGAVVGLDVAMEKA
ncbi:MAG: Ig-like domain-containing protein [Candidatus Bathyarchaeia archaeon]